MENDVAPLLAVVSSVVFWFVSAPSFRFGSVLFFLVLATVLYFCDFECTTHFAFAFAALATVLTVGTNAMQIAGDKTLHNWFCRNYRLLFVLESVYLSYAYIVVSQNMTKSASVCRVVRLLLIGCVSLFFAINMFRNRGNVKEVAQAIFSVFPPPAVSCPVHSVTLQNGQYPLLCVWIPDEGDQCGDAPLPCTPYPSDNLMCLVPGDITKGFWRIALADTLHE